MNMQALMKQAQKLQKDMMTSKSEIDNTEFTGESSLVKVTVKGTKEVIKVEINKDAKMDADDIEMLEDMIKVAINEAISVVDQAFDQLNASLTNGMRMPF